VLTENYSITQIDEMHWKADGLVSLSDAELGFGLVVPDGLDANTLSGLCMIALREMPENEENPDSELPSENMT